MHRVLAPLAATLLVAGTASAAHGPFRTIETIGHQAVSERDVDAATAGFEGRALSLDDLRSLADAFAEPCDRAALALCRADIPLGEATPATLRVRVSEGYVTEVAADDAIAPIVRRVLAAVLAERPLTKATLDRAVANLAEVRGLTVSAVRPERLEGDAYRLVVTGRYRRGGLRGLATNEGSRGADPWRAVLVADRGSLVSPGDSAQVAYLTRPESPGELSYGVLRYAAPVTRGGGSAYAEVNASRSSPRTILAGRDVEGSLLRLIAGYESPLWRRAGTRADLTVSFEGVKATEDEDGQALYRDHLRVARASLFGRHRRARTKASVQVTLSLGLDALGAEGGSRPDGQVRFTTLAAEATATRALGRRGFVRAALTGQLSDAPLLFQEEFSLGGGAYGRAYDFGEVRGDGGVAGYLEAGAKLSPFGPGVSVTPYAYVDAGAVWNRDLDTAADGRTLWSAGAGAKLGLPRRFSLDYEAAWPLSDAPYTEEDDEVRHRLRLGWSTDG